MPSQIQSLGIQTSPLAHKNSFFGQKFLSKFQPKNNKNVTQNNLKVINHYKKALKITNNESKRIEKAIVRGLGSY